MRTQRRHSLVAITLAIALCSAAAQGESASLGTTTLTNGASHIGSISSAGQTQSWSVALLQGDRLVLQIAETSGGAAFSPRIDVLAPDGASLGVSSGAVATRLDLQAPVSGNYTVVAGDATRTGTGAYQLQLAKTPGAFTVPAGDQGAALTNGAVHSGTIDLGDLDPWSFAANPGNRITLQLAETSGGAGFTPMIELFAPNGARLGASAGNTVGRLDAQAVFGGTYTVLVSDATASGAGNYELRLAQTPETFVVPPGDEGGALPDGVDTGGSITLGDLDLWTFSAVVGDRASIQITEVTGGVAFMPFIELLDPNGERKKFAQSASTTTLDFAVEVPGTYTVLVSDATQTGTGTYRLNLARSTLSTGSNLLTNGSTHLGSISAAGQSNIWTFAASAGEMIVVRCGETTTTGFVPWLRLSGPTGLQLAADFSAVAAEVSVRATNSGIFSVAVADGSAARNQTGGYRITLVKTGSPLTISPSDEGGPLTNGLSYLASINSGDIDPWTLTANGGESFAVWIGEVTAGSPLSPWLRVFGPDGTLVASAFSAGAAEATVRATNSGTYLIVVGDGSSTIGGSGNYRISLAKTGVPLTISASDEGGPMANGVTHIGALDIGDIDAWTFIANAGDALVVRAGETTPANFTPWLRLFGPSGELLSADFNAAAAEVTFRATNSGTFTVIVGDGTVGRNNPGNYRISLARTADALAISASDEGGPLVNGTSYLATIETGDIDPWTFTANAGDYVIVRMGEVITTGFTPWLRLYGPNGVLLDQDFNASAAEVAFRATNSGPFLVVATDVTSGIGGTGNYRLSLAKTGSPLEISTSDEGGALSNGRTYLGSIETGDIDAWVFNATAGESIIVRAGETTASALIPWLRLFGPNGALLQQDFNASAAEVVFRATNSGAFLVVAADGTSGIGGTGNYRLSLAKTGEPVTISPGDEGGAMSPTNSYDGMIDVGDADAWTFTVCAGDTISIRVDEAVPNSPLTPWIRLYGRDGVLLNTVFGAATAQINRTAPANGTYLLVVADGTSGIGGSGGYRLTTQGLYGGMRLCISLESPGVLGFMGAGGPPGTAYTVVTATNIATPAALWIPLFTNVFGTFGDLDRRNAINPNIREQFFRLRTP